MKGKAFTDESLIGQLILTLRKMEGQPRNFGDAGRLTPSEIHIISAIGCHEGRLMSEIAREMNITKSAVTQLVQRLEARGYVKRASRPDDKRSRNITLTESGKTAFLAHHLLHERLVLSLRDDLGPDGYASFQSGIRKLIALLEE